MNFNSSNHMLLGSEPHQISQEPKCYGPKSQNSLILTLDTDLKLKPYSGHMYVSRMHVALCLHLSSECWFPPNYRVCVSL